MAKINCDLLKKLRTSNKLTQEEVATIVGIGRTSYTKIEQGKQDVDSETLIKLSHLFQIPTDELLARGTFNLQMFGNNDANTAMAFGKILTLKDEQAKQLTLQIVEDVIQLTIPQLEALSALIKTIK